MKFRYPILMFVALLSMFNPALASEEGITGLWRTSSTDKGFLHVFFEPCGNAICGTIQAAINHQGESDPNNEWLGRKMIWDMVPKGESKWVGGKIWDPTKDKSYKSKMSLEKNVLNVSGCIAFFCRSEKWSRVIDK